jgi:serine/threonine protein kinase
MAQQKAVEPAIDEVDDLIDELQPGAKLLKGQYTITRYLNSGGFGITYLAKDSLDRDVVIKECFPSSVCRRSKVVVAARSRAHTAELRSIIQLFVREARNLAKIVHPNIVAVHQVFEDNGTAYMAIDYIDGLDLQQIIDGEGPPLSPEHIVEVTGKLLRAVGFIHDSDMLHRDISPDNVLIDKTGEPILIDFGAAREQASKTNRAMSALRVVKDGYSPQEFYIAGSEQGPWSDLYALAATFYHLISGEAPVNGQARLGALAEDRPDPYVPLTGRIQGYPVGYLEAIDRAMSTLPKQRVQSAAEWLAMYEGNGIAPVALAEPDPGTDDAVQRLIHDFQHETSSTVSDGSATAAPVAPTNVTSASAATRPVKQTRSRGPVQLVAGVAVALVIVAGGYMVLGPGLNKSVGIGDTSRSTTTADATAAPVETASVVPTATATPEPVTETAAADPTPAPAPAADAGTESAAVTPVPAPAAEATPEPVVKPAVEAAAEPSAEPAVEPAVESAATVEPAPVASEPETASAEPVPEPTVEPAPVEPTTIEAAASTVETPAAPIGSPAANQIAFAAWDVVIPFMSDDRIVGGSTVAVVTRIPPTVDVSVSGDWLAPGVTIHAVNGAPIQSSNAIVPAVMNAMSVDPDGKARMVVDYSDTAQKRSTGLLTVDALRLINLQNGVSLRTTTVDGVWQTEVVGIADPDATTLRQGDILFRDKTTGIPLDGPQSLETIMTDLIARDAIQTEFSIIRSNKVDVATMQLVLAETK